MNTASLSNAEPAKAKSTPRAPSSPLRGVAAGLLALLLAGLSGCAVSFDGASSGASGSSDSSGSSQSSESSGDSGDSDGGGSSDGPRGSALKALGKVKVKGRSAGTGYDRDKFGTAWTDTDHNGCDQRNDILRRDLSDERLKAGTKGCVVLSGTLEDRYTGKTVEFRKSEASKVQIDHVVALQNAWVTGASGWSENKRRDLATDPLNLLATTGSVNASKGSGDAATWLPPRKGFRCAYVARQVAVKVKYDAWMTRAEHDAIERILDSCPGQDLPTAKSAPLG